MKKPIPVALGLGFLAYLGLPYLLVQVLNIGLIREGKWARREVALTFDDGPDPQTTPAVLDALQDAGAKATFFVLAAKAEAHPALIGRMLDEGHQVEAHAVKHRHAWIRSPWGASLDPIRAVRRIGRVTGQPVTLHRPPHGAYTLGTLLGQRAAGVTGAHWSIEGHDWHGSFTPERVRERLNRLLVPGAVVVLHDAGPGAKNTVPMLPLLLNDLHQRKYLPVRLDQLIGAQPQGKAELKRRLFAQLDRVFDRFYHLHFAGERHDNLFRIGPQAFPLSDLTLQDGTQVRRGTKAIEFHVNNPLIVDLGARRAFLLGFRDMGVVLRDWQTRPEYCDAPVIYCISALSPLMAMAGFETVELPETDAIRLRGWANLLRRAYGTANRAQRPKLSILSRQKFIEIFGRYA